MDKPLFGLKECHILYRSRSSRGMPSAAEVTGYLSGIDFRHPAAGYKIYPVPHADNPKEDIEILHDH